MSIDFDRRKFIRGMGSGLGLVVLGPGISACSSLPSDRR